MQDLINQLIIRREDNISEILCDESRHLSDGGDGNDASAAVVFFRFTTEILCKQSAALEGSQYLQSQDSAPGQAPCERTRAPGQKRGSCGGTRPSPVLGTGTEMRRRAGAGTGTRMETGAGTEAREPVETEKGTGAGTKTRTGVETGMATGTRMVMERRGCGKGSSGVTP